MSVTWVQDANSRYEISSVQHLLQLMNQGSLYTDSGTPPSDYWDALYIQTVDIDLATHHANITPIGTTAGAFQGGYDGNLYKISNWSYTSTDSGERVGFFGRVVSGDYRRIRMSGVWTLDTQSLVSGVLCAQAVGNWYDIEADFSEGTSYVIDIASGNGSGGLMLGLMTGDAYGLTVRGIITTIQATSPNSVTCGGVIGRVSFGTTTLCRNIAHFPNGFNGSIIGGVAGNIASNSGATISKCLNAMTGNITATDFAGGVVGIVSSTSALDSAVNSMKGNITATNESGGIIGIYSISSFGTPTVTRALNYMSGNISGSLSSAFIGNLRLSSGTPDISISKSIVAMNGTVDETVFGSKAFTPSPLEVTVDTSFGLQFASDTDGTATMFTDANLLFHPDFLDTPYFLMEATDPDGTEYKWDFIHGNLPTKYPLYSHLSVHNTDVSYPIYVDYDTPITNTSANLTFSNVSNGYIYVDPSLTILETTATQMFDRFTLSVIVIPVTKGDFIIPGKVIYDITDPSVLASIDQNEIFDTGDIVRVVANVSGSRELDTIFVKRGENLDVSNVSSVLAPFEQAVVGTQDINLILSDTTLVPITFDSGSGDVTVQGITHSSGDQFILDGKKVTFKNI